MTERSVTPGPVYVNGREEPPCAWGPCPGWCSDQAWATAQTFEDNPQPGDGCPRADAAKQEDP